MRDQLRLFLKESMHGSAWQMAAFVARIIVLLRVLPYLPKGELAEYLFLTTIAVVVGRLMILGLDGEIPLTVRGNRDLALDVFPVIILGWLLSALTGLLAWVTGHWLAWGLCLAICTANGLYLGAVIRTITPAGFEQNQNLPWIIFGVIAGAIGQFGSASELVALRALGLIVAQGAIASFLNLYRPLNIASLRKLTGYLRGVIWRGWDKVLGTLTLIGAMRGFVVWPEILGGSAPDTVAFAVACGEAFMQFGMVFAHRRYAAFTKAISVTRVMARSASVSAAVSVVVLAGGGILAVVAANSLGIFPARQSPVIVGQAVVFFACLCGLSLLRFLIWSMRRLEWLIVAMQVAIFLIQGVLVFLAPGEYWFIGASALAAAAVGLAGYVTITIAEDKRDMLPP